MSFSKLYNALQEANPAGRVRTGWLTQRTIEYSSINKIKEQWSGLMDGKFLRGSYIEGPMESPPLGEHEALIVLSRAMCKGGEGQHWRRLVFTKELMHSFDKDHEKADTAEKFDVQIERFKDPSVPDSPQFTAEVKALWRALAVLCPETRRLDFQQQLASNAVSAEVVAAALRIPVPYIRVLMRKDFPSVIKKIMD